MDSQITKIPSICGNNYPGVGFQVDSGDSVRVAMAWPSGSAEGWRSLTMEVPKKLSLETELDGVSVETLLKAAGQLFGDNDVDGFKQFEQMLGDKLPSAVVRAFARYAPVDSTHAGSAETCRCEIEQFLDGDIPGNIDVSDIHQEKSIETMLSSAERAKNELRDALLGDEKSFISLLKEYGNDCALEYFDLFESIEQVAVEEDWSDETYLIQTQDLDMNAELYRFDPLGFLEATSAKEVISEVLEEFDDFSDWVAGVDLEYIGAYGAVSDDIKNAMAQYQDAVGKSSGKQRVSEEESLDEMMELKNEVAGDSEIGDELGVSIEER